MVRVVEGKTHAFDFGVWVLVEFVTCKMAIELNHFILLFVCFKLQSRYFQNLCNGRNIIPIVKVLWVLRLVWKYNEFVRLILYEARHIKQGINTDVQVYFNT